MGKEIGGDLAADPIRRLVAGTRQPDHGTAQSGVGGQLLRLVAPFRDPQLQRADLGVEQGPQAGAANLAQRVADAAIGPQADAEQGDQQQQQGEAGAVESGIHGSAV